MADFERLVDRATWSRLVLTGLAVGAAVATKFSTLVLAPILGALALLAVLSPDPMRRAWRQEAAQDIEGRGPRLVHMAVLLAAMALIAVVVLWASYGFATSLSPDPSVDAAFDWGRVSGRNGVIDGAMTAARRLHLLPEAYAFGFLRFFQHSEARPTFLLGRLFEKFDPSRDVGA